MIVYIYALCDPTTGDLRYVGKTINLRHRHWKHCTEKGETHKARWIRTVRGAGLKPTIEVLDVIEHSDDSDWQDVERFWISYLRFLGCKLTNLDSGGVAGKSPSLETRRKMSSARKGRPISANQRAVLLASNIGRKMKPEWIAKQIASRAGKKLSVGVRMKMSMSHMGKRNSPASNAKRRAAMMGRKLSPEHVQKLRSNATGRRHLDSAKKKISAATKGRILSAEHAQKIGAAHKGMKRSHQACINMSVGQRVRFAKKRAASGIPDPTPESRRAKANEVRKAWRAKRKAAGLPY